MGQHYLNPYTISVSQNPLDCDGKFMGCHNPCGHGPKNTAACELLPSAVLNLSYNFFGDVVSTEQEGKTIWSLPCSLEVGLPNNPRGGTEPLGCYFLRLFNGGVVGLRGLPGQDGLQGEDGVTVFTLVAGFFFQPAAPGGQVLISVLSTILFRAGEYVFIETAGWYQIVVVDSPNSRLLLSLVNSLSGSVSGINPGVRMFNSGVPGQNPSQGTPGLKGPPGNKGILGDPGPPGSASYGVGVSTGSYYSPTNIRYEIKELSGFPPYNYTIVSFPGSTTAQVSLPSSGTYFVMADVQLSTIGLLLSHDPIRLRLRNTTTATNITSSAIQFCPNGQNYVPLVMGAAWGAPVRLMGIVVTASTNNLVALTAACGAQNSSNGPGIWVVKMFWWKLA